MPKDLELRDVLQRPVVAPTRVSEYRFGRWSFISLTNPARVVENLQYYYMSNKFGVTLFSQTNPAKTKARGKAGDYISYDTQNQTVSVVPSAEFKMLFPSPNHNPPTPKVTSAALKDKNKITEIYQESKGKVSYKGKKKLTGIKGLNKPSY